MKRNLLAFFTVLVVTSWLIGGEKPQRPFSRLLEATEGREPRWNNVKRGWHIRKVELSKLFNQERKRLGERFDVEVIKFVDGDTARHREVSSYLTSKGYLGGNRARPYLALAIIQQGIVLCEKRKGPEDRTNLVVVNVAAAIVSKNLGFHDLALAHKTRAEQLVAKNKTLEGAWPALDARSRKTYESIKLDTTSAQSKPKGS